MLARAFKTGGGIVPALTGTGSKPPAVNTVPHSCGSFAIARELRGLSPTREGPTAYKV